MILDPLAPFTPQARLVHAGQHGRILDGDHRLVIVAIQRPGLHLAERALTAVQPFVEAVTVVIALGADPAQGRLEGSRVEEFTVEMRRGLGRTHRANSIPSWATCHPAASTRTRSADPSTRTGLVLLM